MGNYLTPYSYCHPSLIIIAHNYGWPAFFLLCNGCTRVRFIHWVLCVFSSSFFRFLLFVFCFLFCFVLFQSIDDTFFCCCWRISSCFVLFQSTDNTFFCVWMDFLFSDWLGQRRLPPSSIAYFRQETDDHITSPSSSSASSSSSCFFVCMYLYCMLAWQIWEFSAFFPFVLPSTDCFERCWCQGQWSWSTAWNKHQVWLGLKNEMPVCLGIFWSSMWPPWRSCFYCFSSSCFSPLNCKTLWCVFGDTWSTFVFVCLYFVAICLLLVIIPVVISIWQLSDFSVWRAIYLTFNIETNLFLYFVMHWLYVCITVGLLLDGYLLRQFWFYFGIWGFQMFTVNKFSF